MRLIICDDYKMISYSLPEKIEDFYMVNYYNHDLDITETIMLEPIDNKWVINNNDSINLYFNNNIVPRVTLEPYLSCQIKFGDFNNPINLIVMPDNLDHFEVRVNNLPSISIGSANNCNIIYADSKVLFNQATISFTNDRYVLKVNNENNSHVYVNYYNTVEKVLSLGDVIFINGLEIIWMESFMKLNNPNNKLKLAGLNLIQRSNNDNRNSYNPITESERNIKLYRESDLFFHTTRLKTKITMETISIEPPPEAQPKENTPKILSVGSSAIFGITSCMTGVYAVRELTSGNADIFSAVIELVMCGLMLLGCMFFPMLADMYQEKQLKKYEKLRQKKYKEYLASKVDEINKIEQKQKATLIENNYSLDDIKTRMTNNHNGVWQREIIDDDFLEVTLGVGDIDAFLQIEAPVEQFSLYEDNLKEEVAKIANENRILKDVPINVSMVKNRITPFIINATFKEKYINSIMLQLLFYYSGLDLKIVVLTNEENASKWDYLKFLPHCWSNNHDRRFFATTETDMQQLSTYLEQEYDKRMGLKNEDDETTSNFSTGNDDIYKNFSEYYLIITDDYKTVKKLSIIDKIVHVNKNFGFSLLLFEDTLKNLPSRVEKFVNIGESFGNLCSRDLEIANQISFKPTYTDVDLNQYMKIFANIPLISSSQSTSIPTSLTFLDMFRAGRVEQLNILSRWTNSNPTISLHTPIGMMANNKYIELDLHENFHGPHGLIAGTTGSGKSEFIMTFILSLAVNYHPDEVQFVLIDYKGGGLAGVFENRESGIKIPHLIGTITNLDTSEMHRTLVSIKSELERRQITFNKAREELNEGTIDIYKYQSLYREGKVKEPMSHLFVISDEFAELKDQQPDFMDELISTARIGRSLGIHLILATQKPSGVVNDQIWSNSRFKICLKVQTTEDSQEVLKKPDAAYIKEVGRFYLQVGNDELFELGQSAYSGAKYVPVDRLLKKMDDDIVFVDNTGNILKKINNEIKSRDNENHGEQITNIVRYLNDIAVRENIGFKNLWLPSLPSFINLKELLQKYNYKPIPYDVDVVVGEYDDPSNINQGLVSIDLTNNNLLICGIPGSGKESLLTTLIYSACTNHTPYEVQFYLLDFGSESLSVFRDMPHVGDFINVDSINKVYKEFNFLEKEIQKRKNLFVDYSGSYTNYIKNSGEKLPLIVTVINGYESFMESCGDAEDSIIHLLREGVKYGIVMITTTVATNSMRTTLMECFQKKVMLQIADPYDYQYILNAPRGLEPKKCFGRGLTSIGEDICEFQTASIDINESVNNTIKSTSKYLMEYYHFKANDIKLLPNKVKFDEIKNYCNDISKLPIGYIISDVDLYYYNFLNQKINLILSNDIMGNSDFMCGILDLFNIFGNNISVNIIDLLSCIETEGNATYYDSNFEVLFNNIMQNKSEKITINIIIGVGNFDVMNDRELQMFNTIMNNVDIIKNNYFIIIDDYERFISINSLPWYDKINFNNGIWIGSGILEQDIFNTNNSDDIDEDILCSYVIEENNILPILAIGDKNYESDDDL